MKKISLPNITNLSLIEWLIRSTLEIIKILDFNKIEEINVEYIEFADNKIKETLLNKVEKQKPDSNIIGMDEDFIPFIFNQLYYCLYSCQNFCLHFKEIDIKIELPIKDDIDTIKNIHKIFKDKEENIFGNQTELIENYNRLTEYISSLWFSGKKRSNLLEKINNLKLNHILISLKGFPTKKYTNEFLIDFYELCGDVLSDIDTIAEFGENGRQIYKQLELLGCHVNNSENNNIFIQTSIYTPRSLLALTKIYEQLYEILVNNNYKDETNSIVHDEIIVKELLNNFEQFYYYDRNLYLSEINRKEIVNPVLPITAYNWQNKTSLHPINLNNICPMIKKYVQKVPTTTKEINIAIFGSITLSNLYEMYNFINQNDLKVNIDVYMSQFDKMPSDVKLPDCISINYYDCPTNINFFSQFLNQHVSNYNLIFSLNTPWIFRDFLNETVDLSITQHFVKILNNKELLDNKKDQIMRDLYSELGWLCENSNSKLQISSYTLQHQFILQLLEQLSYNNQYKEIHFLMLESAYDINLSDYDRKAFLEEYYWDGTKIFDLNLHNIQNYYMIPNGLKNINEDYISFNMLDLIRAISNNLLDKLFKIEDKNISVLKALENINIRLSWKYINNERNPQMPFDYEILWSYNEELPEFKIFRDKNCQNIEDKKRVISAVINSLLVNYFSEDKKDNNNDLYASIKNVLFNHAETLKQLVSLQIAGQGYKKIIKCTYCENLEKKQENSYPFMRVYEKIISCMDNPKNSADELEYNLLRILRTLNCSELILKKDLRKTCENLGYTKSLLYENINKPWYL